MVYQSISLLFSNLQHRSGVKIAEARDTDGPRGPILCCDGGGPHCQKGLHLHCAGLDTLPPQSQQFFCPACVGDRAQAAGGAGAAAAERPRERRGEDMAVDDGVEQPGDPQRRRRSASGAADGTPEAKRRSRPASPMPGARTHLQGAQRDDILRAFNAAAPPAPPPAAPEAASAGSAARAEGAGPSA